MSIHLSAGRVEGGRGWRSAEGARGFSQAYKTTAHSLDGLSYAVTDMGATLPQCVNRHTLLNHPCAILTYFR